MPISDDDLNYLRNINTRPGPNAGKSIDPTKPGPDADSASPEPQNVRVDANVETVAAVRRAIKEAWLVDGEKTDFDADRLALAAIKALAQSDAGPDQHDTRKALQDTLWRLIDDARYMRNATEYEFMSGELAEKYAAKIALAQSNSGPDRSVRGEPIPDCPTDGVAARQGNGG